MASSDEAKVKLSADISTFNSAINSAKSTITELNSALRLVQTQMNTNGTSTDQLQQKLNTLKEKSSALKSEEEALKQKLDATVAVYGENSTEAQKLQTQLNNVQTQEAKVEQEINQTNQAIEEQQKAEEQAQTASAQLVNTISQQEQELDELKQQYTNVVLEEGKDSEAAQELAGKITDLNADLQDNKQKLADAEQAADDLTKSEEELGNEGEEAGDKMGEGFQMAYDALVSAGLIEACKKLVEAMKACVDAAAGFESQMSTVKALSGATSDEMDDLTAAAKEMGATTSFTATEAGEAMEYMALAGWSADEMMDGLGGVINLAAAAGEDLGTTCDIVTDALTAFGMEASDTAHFTDVLAAASTSSNTTVSQMGEAFKQVATTAGTLGYSIDDVSVALGLMADNGIKGSSAGTTLATALTRMSGTNASATAELEKLNVSMFDSQGETKDLATFLDELRTALKENCTTDAEMQTALYNLAGQRGMKGLAAIVNTTDEDFAALTNSIDTCEGSAEEMADIKLDNFEGSVTLLKSAWDGLMQTMGGEALGVLQTLVEAITDIVTRINDFLSEHPAVAAAIDALCVGLVAGAAALGVAAIACSELTTKVKELTAAMMDNQIGLIIAAITAAVAAVAAFVAILQTHETEAKRVRQETKELTKEIEEQKEAYEDTCDAIEETATNYSALVSELDSLLKKTDKEESDFTRINSIVSELNDYLGENAVAYDKDTDSIGMTTEALEALVDAQAASTANDAAIEQQTALYEEQAQVQAELETAYADQEEAINSIVAARQADADMMGYTIDAEEVAASATTSYDKQIRTLEASLEDVNARIDEVNGQINDFAAATEEASTTEDLAREAIEEMCADIQTLDAAYQDAYDSAKESLEGQFSLWEEAEEIIPASVEEVQKAIESQMTNMENYTDQMQELLNSDIDGMADYVAAYSDGSEESMKAIATMASFDEEERKAMIALMGEWAADVETEANIAADAQSGYTKQVSALVDEVVDDYGELDGVDLYEVGISTMEGYVNGIEDEEGNIEGTIEGVGEKAIDIFNEACGTHSPSWKTEETGADTIQGFVNGADSEAGEAQSTMSDIAKSSLDAFDSLANSAALVGTGQDTVTGYKSGAASQDNATSTEMKDIAQNALSSFKGVSTSNALTASGQDTLSGYITGTNNKLSLLTSSMMSHAKSAIQNFTSLASSNALYSAGADTIQGAINGASSKGTNFTSTLANIASNALSKFKSTLGVASPSWIAEETLEDFDEGAVIGAQNGSADLNTAMVGVAGDAMEAFNGAMQAPEMDLGNVVSMYDYLNGRLSNLSTDIQLQMNIDYDRLAEAMSRYNMTVSIGEREFGRVVREVI